MADSPFAISVTIRRLVLASESGTVYVSVYSFSSISLPIWAARPHALLMSRRITAATSAAASYWAGVRDCSASFEYFLAIASAS